MIRSPAGREEIPGREAEQSCTTGKGRQLRGFSENPSLPQGLSRDRSLSPLSAPSWAYSLPSDVAASPMKRKIHSIRGASSTVIFRDSPNTRAGASFSSPVTIERGGTMTDFPGSSPRSAVMRRGSTCSPRWRGRGACAASGLPGRAEIRPFVFISTGRMRR